MKRVPGSTLGMDSIIPAGADTSLRVGTSRFDPIEGVVSRADGQKIVLRPQTAKVLARLLSSPDRLVTKRQLLDELWPGKSVTEDSLVQCIGEIRKAILDSDQTMVVTSAKRGYQFVSASNSEPAKVLTVGDTTPKSDIRFTQSSDGVSIAYTMAGHGYPLIRTSTWTSCIDFEHATVHWPAVVRFNERFANYRYNARGLSLSGGAGWPLSIDTAVTDLDAVVQANHLRRFALFGVSQGAMTAIAYAARYPERVSHLVIVSGMAAGSLRPDAPPAESEQFLAVQKLVALTWGQDNMALQAMFMTRQFPDAAPEAIRHLAELQRRTASAEQAVANRLAVGMTDVRDCLANVRCPTLVFHSTGDGAVATHRGREIAERIEGARFVQLDTRNHFPIVGEPAFEQMFSVLDGFLPR